MNSQDRPNICVTLLNVFTDYSLLNIRTRLCLLSGFSKQFILDIFLFVCFLAASLLRVGFLLVAASTGYSSLQCAGFSLRWLLLLQSTGSRHAGFSSCGSWALERRLSSCGAQAQLLRGMWDLHRRALEPVSPALAGGFLTTAPPGKPYTQFFSCKLITIVVTVYFHFYFLLKYNIHIENWTYLFI